MEGSQGFVPLLPSTGQALPGCGVICGGKEPQAPGAREWEEKALGSDCLEASKSMEQTERGKVSPQLLFWTDPSLQQWKTCFPPKHCSLELRGVEMAAISRILK